MSKTLSTCGDLRELLGNTILGVKDGSIKVDQARTMIKAAEKITENFYSEIKVAQLQILLGKKAEEIGNLPINK